MRQNYYTVTPGVVRDTARQALETALPVQSYGRLVTPKRLLELLLLVAALRSSLSALVRRFRFGFSHETARKAVAANLPPKDHLTKGLLDALYRFGSRALRRRRWVIAIDEHREPFYGDRPTEGVTGGQKKAGSKYAYSYATAVLVHHRHRFTVGLIALDGSLKPHQIVATLLEQIQSRGLKVRGVVLDSGFDSGETFLLLQERQLSYTVPLRKKGNGTNRRNAAWDLELGTVTEVAWKTEETRRAVQTQAVVVQRPGEKDKKVYAFGGWDADQARSELQRARLAQRWYRKRFGIETSYRQKNQGEGKTTKKDVAYRLLLLGLALLLRQVWVWLTAQVARAWGRRPTQWLSVLPLERMCQWLADLLKEEYPEEKVVSLGCPLLPLDAPRL